MQPDKPITELKRLLGFPTNTAVAHFMGMTRHTANNVNSPNAARGSENLRRAYQIICRLLERVPVYERRSFFEKPAKKELTLSRKYQKTDAIRKKLPELAVDVQKGFEEAADKLMEYIGLHAEYEELRKL